MRLFLISGLSGSGKSVALKVLEDSDYYCVDNLPAELLPTLIDNLRNNGCTRAAASVDVRSSGGVELLPMLIQQFKLDGIEVELLFLDAHTDMLVQRFSETRRRHPLSNSGLTLPECIQQERTLLEPIAEFGHRIDSTELAPNALRAWVKQFIEFDHARLTLLFQSFGFKHGLPLDADFVFDVRCLPNPFYDPKLRPLTGRDAAVIAFLDSTPAVDRMVNDIRQFVEHWLPSFVADNRSYLTISIGCTGGQHRSVYISERLGRHFTQHQQQVLVRHRELSA